MNSFQVGTMPPPLLLPPMVTSEASAVAAVSRGNHILNMRAHKRWRASFASIFSPNIVALIKSNTWLTAQTNVFIRIYIHMYIYICMYAYYVALSMCSAICSYNHLCDCVSVSFENCPIHAESETVDAQDARALTHKLVTSMTCPGLVFCGCKNRAEGGRGGHAVF